METLFQLGGWFCGQQIDHTWLVGGVPLPVCQRCTGLFAGAFCALVLAAAFRPRLEGGFLLLHGGFLIGMAPFGLHWIEHGPEVRTITGACFGAGVLLFLGALPAVVFSGSGWGGAAGRVGGEDRGNGGGVAETARNGKACRRYVAWFCVSVAALLCCCRMGGSGSARILAALIAAGMGALVGMVILNAAALAWCLARAVRIRPRPARS